MAYCANCGSSVEGNFCAKCGSSAAGSAPSGGPVMSQAPVAAEGMSENVAAALCYVLSFITGILFLVLAPYNQNKTVRFHAFQSIFLGVVWIGFWFVLNILFVAMHFLGAFFILTLSPLIGLAFFVLYIYLIVSAYQGKQVVLPIIGPAAQKQA
jgi:uncharacterized membrane protein